MRVCRLISISTLRTRQLIPKAGFRLSCYLTEVRDHEEVDYGTATATEQFTDGLKFKRWVRLIRRLRKLLRFFLKNVKVRM